jgi:peptide/nickel transport system permease protein
MAATTVPGPYVPPVVEEEDFQVERHGVWKRFKRHKLAIGGAVVGLLIVLVAICAPLLHLQDPNAIDQANWSGTPLAPGVAGHLLGTDEAGRDLLSRMVWGAQISLQVAFFAVLMELTIGTIVGAIAGYYGGWIDYALMRVTDVFLSIPLLRLRTRRRSVSGSSW